MEKAYHLLGIPLNSSQAVIKRAYYKKALLLHPDKNAHANAAEQFRELQNAYTLLREDQEQQEEVWFDTSAMLDLLANSLSEETLIAMYKFLIEYSAYIPKHQYLLKLIESKLSRPHIVVEPSLYNLFEQKIFIYTHDDGKKYSIPLWHHTLFFENLIVVCNPKTNSADVWVDDTNNIHVSVNCKISNLLTDGKLVVTIDHRNFTVNTSELGIITSQTYVLEGQGIPRPNTENVLDVSSVSDIVVHIHLS
jgi:DnaJ-class molecular chaperone